MLAAAVTLPFAFNRSYLKGLLAKSKGNVTAAASMAGLDRSNFRRLLKQFAVAPKRGTEGSPTDAANDAADAQDAAMGGDAGSGDEGVEGDDEGERDVA